MAEKLTEVAATSPQHNQGGLTTGAPVTCDPDNVNQEYTIQSPMRLFLTHT